MPTPSGTDDGAVRDARRFGATQRRVLGVDDRTVATRNAVDRLLGLPELATPGPRGVLAASIAVRDELDVSSGFDVLRSRGWRVALPVVIGDAPPAHRPAGVPTDEQGRMSFRLHEPGTTLVPGRFGIPEPLDAGDDLSPSDLDVVVAPCVAVDEAGTRVGFGAGYYDRALADADTRPVVVVVAFEVQVVRPDLPVRAWDVPADVVVTDRRTIRLSGTAVQLGRGPVGGGSGGAPAR